MPSLNETAKQIIGMPDNIALPNIPAEFDNLQVTKFSVKEIEKGKIDFRRNYIDPCAYLLMAAEDSGAPRAARELAGKTLKTMYGLYESKYLPQRYNLKNINDHNNNGHYYEHALNDWLIPWAKITNSKEAERIINGYARWLIWDQENGTFGFRKRREDTLDWYRAWMRRVWNLVAFSETDILGKSVRYNLSELAKKELIWAGIARANGSISKAGWASARRMFFGDVDSSIYNNKRVIHTFFLEINHNTCQQLLLTQFYKQNKQLVDKWIGMTVTTTNQMLEKLEYSQDMLGDSAPPSITNIRTENIHIDRFYGKGKYNRYDKIDGGLAPCKFFLSITDQDELDQLIKEASIEWKPDFSFNPHLITKWTLLNNEEQSTVTQTITLNEEIRRLKEKLKAASKKIDGVRKILNS